MLIFGAVTLYNFHSLNLKFLMSLSRFDCSSLHCNAMSFRRNDGS